MIGRTNHWLLVSALASSPGCSSEEVAELILGEEPPSSPSGPECSGRTISDVAVTIDGQQELDAFGARIGADDCTRLDGGLSISDSAGTLTDLTPLHGLVWVTGELRIHDAPALASLAGLDGLTHVAGLTLEDLPMLITLAPLGGLQEVDGTLQLSDLDSLTSLSGLDAVHRIRPRSDDVNVVLISGNDALSSLEGITTVQIEMRYQDYGAAIVLNRELPTCDAIATLENMGISAYNAFGNKDDACS